MKSKVTAMYKTFQIHGESDRMQNETISKTRTTIVVSNGRCTFYQKPFIKYPLSNTFYQIPFIKYHLSNTIDQITFI